MHACPQQDDRSSCLASDMHPGPAFVRKPADCPSSYLPAARSLSSRKLVQIAAGHAMKSAKDCLKAHLLSLLLKAPNSIHFSLLCIALLCFALLSLLAACFW